MKINLRKASALDGHIKGELSRLSSEGPALNINLFDADITSKIKAHEQAFLEAEAQFESLLKARSELRAKVAQRNVEVGIHALLAEDATLELQERRLKGLQSIPSRLSDEGVTSLAERLLSQEQLTFTVRLDALTEEVIEGLRVKLSEVQRRRRRLKDQMVTINVNAELELSEESAQILRELGLD